MAFLIDIEGTDGCGKQTQSLMLVDALKNAGHDAFRQDFPNYESLSSGPVKMFLAGDFGDSAYSIEPYQVCSLYAVDRLCTFKTLAPRLKEDTVLVLDRYTNSNVIHNATKFEDVAERDKCIDWIYDFEYKTLKLPAPDIVFFLDMPIEMSMKLADERAANSNTKMDVNEKNKEYQIKTYNKGKAVAQKLGWTIISCAQNGTIRSKEDIHQDILRIALQKIKEKF